MMLLLKPDLAQQVQLANRFKSSFSKILIFSRLSNPTIPGRAPRAITEAPARAPNEATQKELNCQNLTSSGINKLSKSVARMKLLRSSQFVIKRRSNVSLAYLNMLKISRNACMNWSINGWWTSCLSLISPKLQKPYGPRWRIGWCCFILILSCCRRRCFWR
jgi:hypothetical protein